MKKNLWIYLVIILFPLVLFSFHRIRKQEIAGQPEIGQKIDSLHGVYVYYNGAINNISGRNLTEDGYNLGLKYQCVEFVKRYYYEHLNHKMPDSYGNAKDFFNTHLGDGQLNTQRNLMQYTNPSKVKPKPNDLLIFKATVFNKFGHVAIISKVNENTIEVIQQNSDSSDKTREVFRLNNKNDVWEIENKRIMGWLRKER